jgi:hypothetical protein
MLRRQRSALSAVAPAAAATAAVAAATTAAAVTTTAAAVAATATAAAGSLASAHLVEAVPAVHRAVASRLERHLRRLAAAAAHNVE